MNDSPSRPRPRVSRISIVTVLAVLGLGHAAHAEMIERTETFSGLTVTYKVVLPNGYDPSRAYPAVLVFAGGPQTLQGATRIVENDWRVEAERRGYIIVSPASPSDSLFYEDADQIFPEFLDRLLRDYKVRGKLHVAGASNGGISAFHVAVRYPQYFATIIGYPGMLDRLAMTRTFALKDLCVFMHVGDRDAWWVANMQAQAKVLTGRGFKVQFTVEKNQNHGLKAAEINLSARLFDEIESCSN